MVRLRLLGVLPQYAGDAEFLEILPSALNRNQNKTERHTCLSVLCVISTAAGDSYSSSIALTRALTFIPSLTEAPPFSK